MRYSNSGAGAAHTMASGVSFTTTTTEESLIMRPQVPDLTWALTLPHNPEQSGGGPGMVRHWCPFHAGRSGCVLMLFYNAGTASSYY